MAPFDPQKYGPVIGPLLAGAELGEIGPGRPDESLREALQALTPETLFPGQPLLDREMGRACLAGLWLAHGFLDESHAISQEIATPTGSYWHGILHRREPDYDNAKYWFRHVGNHPIFEPLGEETRRLGLRLRTDCWNAAEFIDLCEQYRGTGGEMEMLLRQVQQREFELLFDWCFHRTVGKESSTDQ